MLDLAGASKLDESQLVFQSAQPVREHLSELDFYTEVGWHVTCVGGLKEITDFLYLLKVEPRLTQVSKLSMQPRDATNSRVLKASFDCTTLVLSGKGWPAPKLATQSAPADLLASAERTKYNSIADRDIFSPYTKRPGVPAPPPPGRPTPPSAPPSPPLAAGPDYNRYRVAGLSQFGPDDDLPVLLVDSSAQKGQQYGAGQMVLDLRIVMVDYRPLPSPAQPDVLSPSRLILQQKDGTYWAVELGQTLGTKHLLEDNQLPEELLLAKAQAAASQPASGPAVKNPPQVPENKEDKSSIQPATQPATESELQAKQTGTSPLNES